MIRYPCYKVVTPHSEDRERRSFSSDEFAITLEQVGTNTFGTPHENSLLARFAPPCWWATEFGVKFVRFLGVTAAAIPLIAWIYAATQGFGWLLIVLACIAAAATLAATLLPRAGRDDRLDFRQAPTAAE